LVVVGTEKVEEEKAVLDEDGLRGKVRGVEVLARKYIAFRLRQGSCNLKDHRTHFYLC